MEAGSGRGRAGPGVRQGQGQALPLILMRINRLRPLPEQRLQLGNLGFELANADKLLQA